MSEGPLQEEPLGEVAIVGMACRLPGAVDIEAFWRNLTGGVESVDALTDEDLAKLPDEWVKRENFVGVSGSLEGIDLFDPGFFGLSPREAAATDPQQRLFLEVGWQALLAAGQNPDDPSKAIGVFAGAGDSRYLDLVRRDSELGRTLGPLQLAIGNGKDHLAPRLSYLLDLRGPSVPVSTACSTSLVAVHLACQSLLHFECDVAMAGGCSVAVPARSGYLYQEGGTLSPDGRCRAFDAAARGTSQGSGVGVVVLRRLAEALADGDHIHAVIRGSAINNDGGLKVGYTAPSVEGQRRVIEEALAVADLDPGEISMVEAHGTGTTLGDPIEVEALRQAFGNLPPGSCALGSVKTNIGHCDAAAGISGLLKAILCLENKTLVPSLNFESPNPDLRLEDSPFFVNTQTIPWQNSKRWAGVSSFGIGGTNAHVVLGEAPPRQPSGSPSRSQLLTLSAHSPGALETLRKDLARFLEASSAHPSGAAPLADIAFSLNAGRRSLKWRMALSCGSPQEAAERLQSSAEGEALDGNATPSVVFLFPGQGKAYKDLGAALYRQEEVFRREVDLCCRHLEADLGLDLAELMFSDDPAARAELQRPRHWQPALFVSCYSLARQWMDWGVHPEAMVGHSLGEYVAATLAGVLRLEDALRLVAARGRGTEELLPGAMLAVPMSEETLAPRLRGEVSLAAVNAPELCVLAGPRDEIDLLAEELAEHQPIRLDSEHAFHSTLVEPLMAPLRELAASFQLQEGQIPYLSNVTGTWMSRDDALDPGYWARHLRSTIRFDPSLRELESAPGRILLEVGPGEVLTRLAGRRPEGLATVASLASSQSDEGVLVSALGRLWQKGLKVDWQAFYAGEERRKVVLPPYPFERKRYWVGEGLESQFEGFAADDSDLDSRAASTDWLFLPVWKEAPLGLSVHPATAQEQPRRWLLFMDAAGCCEGLASRLEAAGDSIVRARKGLAFANEGEGRVTLAPLDAAGYGSLFGMLQEAGEFPDHIVHGWGMVGENGQPLADSPSPGFESLILLAQALASLEGENETDLVILTRGALGGPGPPPNPYAATALGVVRVLPKEISSLRCRHLDLYPEGEADGQVEEVLAELIRGQGPESLALRWGSRWVEGVEARRLPAAAMPASAVFPSGGQYLILHGLQEMGLSLAERLVARGAGRVVLIDRSFFPTPDDWPEWCRLEGEDDPISQHIRRLEALGGTAQVRTIESTDALALGKLRKEIGAVNEVFLLEKAPESGLIQGREARKFSQPLESMAQEIELLAEHWGSESRLVLFSSNAAECGGIGQVSQAATNTFLNAFAQAHRHRGGRALVVDWGTRGWQESTQSKTSSVTAIARQLELKRNRFGMSPEECLDLLEKILDLDLTRAIVSTRDFSRLMEQQHLFTADYFQKQTTVGEKEHSRPDISTPYEAPRNEVEVLLEEVWREFFGIAAVGVDDNFFELGGHSLLAVQVLAKVNETFSTHLVLNDFFDAPSIATLATLVTEEAVDESEAAELQDLLMEIEGLSNEEVLMALEERPEA